MLVEADDDEQMKTYEVVSVVYIHFCLTSSSSLDMDPMVVRLASICYGPCIIVGGGLV